MTNDGESLQNFNLDTMSGIYPGTRTQVYQRLRLRPLDDAYAPAGWYTLQWYAAPPSLILRALNPDRSAPEAVLSLAPLPDDPLRFSAALRHTLAAQSLRADACFDCRHWRPRRRTNDDGVPLGQCTWGQNDNHTPDQAERMLRPQSGLSLACANFQRREDGSAFVADNVPDEGSLRLQKSAELDPDRLPFWPRLWRKLRGRGTRRTTHTHDWATQLVERSGVGAGTEPCFVCQGRLANLGALAVESDEGDKQTFSVWRCRACYTTYLNDWTDRWERLESLETEERYFRLAPAEAHAVLHIIHTTPGGDHPAQRHERRHQRAQILAMLAGKRVLSHQIRQGR